MDRVFTLQSFFDDASTGPLIVCDGSEAAAIGRAMSQAKRDNAPVDVRFPEGRDENEQYIGTASPSEYHTKGARWSRSELRG